MRERVNHFLAIIKAGISAIPFAGGPISSLLGDYLPSSMNTAETTSQETNHPDLFPDLNETTLKKHIKKKITNTPFGEIISKISLYESNVHGFKYQLIVEAPEYHKGFSNIARNWETESPLEDDFSDIYRERPKDNYRTEWSCSVTDLEPQLQDTLVVKSAKWVLY